MMQTIILGALLFAWCDADMYHEHYQNGSWHIRRSFVHEMMRGHDGQYYAAGMTGPVMTREAMARYRSVCEKEGTP